jgi:hypothetical protein
MMRASKTQRIYNRVTGHRLSGLWRQGALATVSILLWTGSAFGQTTNYYWKDGQGNGRWDWSDNQWFIDGGGNVGVPRTDGGAVLYFQQNGSTNTFINSGFTSGFFRLNSIILDSNSSGRNYTVTAENGGTGIELFNTIETQTNSGTLTINSVTQAAADSFINAFGGTITLGELRQNGKTVTFNGGSNTNVGDVVNGPGTGSIQKNGTGTLTFGGTADNLSVTATVNNGTLVLNKASSGSVHAVGSGLTVNANGVAQLSGTGGDQIFTSSFVTINNGGTFKTAGLSEGSRTASSTPGVGALTLQGGATIDFATGANGSTLSAASGVVTGAGTISILNWTGTLYADNGSATNDRLLYETDPGFSAGQLAQFQFYDDTGTAIGAGAMEIAFNGWTEIVPVPEPSTWISGFLSLGGLIVFTAKRRVFRRKL